MSICLWRIDAVRCVTKQHFSNSYKVHDLGDAKERGDDKGPATGPLEKSRGTLVPHNFSAKKGNTNISFYFGVTMRDVNQDSAPSVDLTQSTTPL